MRDLFHLFLLLGVSSCVGQATDSSPYGGGQQTPTVVHPMGTPAAATSVAPADGLLIVNGVTITDGDLSLIYNPQPTLSPMDYPQEEGQALLDRAINRALVLGAAQSAGYSDPGTIDGTVWNRYKDHLAESFLISAFLDKEVMSGITVSPAEVEAWYLANIDQFQQPARVESSHILICHSGSRQGCETERTEEDALAIAEDLAVQALSGVDFAELAIEHSDGPSGPGGGSLGWASQGQFVPAFEEAAFALEVGDVSGAVKTDFGYHVIFVTNKEAAGAATLDLVAEMIAERLKTEKSQQAVSLFVSGLRESAEIDVPQPAG